MFKFKSQSRIVLEILQPQIEMIKARDIVDLSMGKLKYSGIYTLLARMEERALIESFKKSELIGHRAGRRDNLRYYQITDEGFYELKRKIEENVPVKSVWKRMFPWLTGQW